MKKQAIFSPNKIILPLILPFLLLATLWACLIAPLPAQAQGGEEESWRTLETPFERVGQVLEDKEGNIWVVSWTGQVISSDRQLTASHYSEIFACSNSTQPVPHSITETQSAKEISWETIPGEGLAKFEQGDWSTYTAENTNGDLPGDSIHAALFDQEGHLWLAVSENKTVSDSVTTEDIGVVRFDGNQWQTFTVSNTNGGLADNSVRDIFEDQAGNLWFATLAGLSRYDRERWTIVANQNDLGAEGTFRVFQDSKNRLWVTLLDFRNGTSTGCGVARSAPITATGGVTDWQTFTEADGLADDYVLSIAEDAEGDIWFGTFNGISRFDGENWETFNSELPDHIVLQVMSGYEGDMWAATSGGVAKYVSGEWQKFGGDQSTVSIFKDSERLVWFSNVDNGLDYYTGYNRKIFSKANGNLGSNDIRGLLEASDGAIWVATEDGGVSQYQEGKWLTFTADNSDLASNQVWDLFETSVGVIWVSTSGGVSRYQDGEWQTFTVESGYLVWSLFETSEGAIWARTYNGGVSRYQDEVWQTFTADNSDLASNEVRDLFEAREGAIWARTDNRGVSRYQDEVWQTFTADNSDLASNEVKDLFEASDGAIWVGMLNGGVSRYQDKVWQTFTVESGDLASNEVKDLFEASDEAIWARTDDHGVSRYQDEVWQSFTIESGDLASNEVSSLFEASDGAIWAGMIDGGVSRYQDEVWQTFTVESGDLASNVVRYLFEASDGAIWASTSNGESRYRNGKWEIFTYEEYDFLNLHNIHANSTLQHQLTDRDGFIWSATDDGLVRALTNHRLFWVEIKTVNRNTVKKGVVFLYYDDRRRVSIDSVGNNLVTHSENLQYRYKLENSSGETDGWQTTNDTIYFEELDPGEYTLLVKAIDEGGLESEPAVLEITVEEPPLTPLDWFVRGLGVMTLGGLVIFGGSWWRLRKATEWDIERHFNPFIGEVAVKDPEMFFGRQEILHDVLRSIQATNFVIYGEKRIGKTSLLHQIDHRLSEMEGKHFDYLPLVVSLHAMWEERFFRDLMRKMVARIKKKGRYPAEGLFLECEQEADMPYDSISFNGDLDTLQSALDAESDLPLRVVLLVDEADVLKRYSQDTLAQLRETFMTWAGDYLKIVLTCEGQDERAWELEGSPWMSIFGKSYWLTPFTDEEARELIVEPVPNYRYQPEAIERILERSQLVPRHIQNICRQTINEMLADKTGTITLDHVESGLPKVENLPPDVTNEEEEEEES